MITDKATGLHEIVLNGCDESHFPLSAMAACGVLRILTRLASQGEASNDDVATRPRLSWQAQPRWTAVLHTRLTHADVVRALGNAAAQATLSPVWTVHSDPKKLAPEAYRDLLRACDETWEEGLSAALTCEWPLTRAGKLMLTPFFMASGRQQWFTTICTAAKTAAYPNAGWSDSVEEALHGPWRYTDDLSALGWDPAAERHHALEAQAPTKSPTKAVASAVWLAAESLALFPCVASSAGVQVPVFDDKGQTFFWPVWTSPITYDALHAICQLPYAHVLQGADAEATQAFRQELRARGISAVFASRRMESPAGRGYFFFSPSNLVWSN